MRLLLAVLLVGLCGAVHGGQIPRGAKIKTFGDIIEFRRGPNLGFDDLGTYFPWRVRASPGGIYVEGRFGNTSGVPITDIEISFVLRSEDDHYIAKNSVLLPVPQLDDKEEVEIFTYVPMVSKAKLPRYIYYTISRGKRVGDP